MIPAMRFFMLALRFEVDGSLRHHRQLADRHCSKMHIDRRAVWCGVGDLVLKMCYLLFT